MVARKSFCILLFLAVLVIFSSVSSAHPVLNNVEKRDVSIPNRLVKRFDFGKLKAMAAKVLGNPALKAQLARVGKAVSNIKSSNCTPQKRSYFIQDELMKRDAPPAEAGQTPTGDQLSPEDEAFFEQMFQEMFGVSAESVPESDPKAAEMLELLDALYDMEETAPAGAGQP